MKRFLPLLAIGCLLTNSVAQQKSARTYYEEALKAGGLPSLPYVCFRTTTETSQNQKEVPYNDPTFAMLGSTKQIADIIKNKNHEHMNDTDRGKLQKLRGSDYLYVQGFDHGVDGGVHVFDRKNPEDPSRADWVFEGISKKTPFTWDFNINWATLRFREKLSMNSEFITYYGQCELVDSTSK